MQKSETDADLPRGGGFEKIFLFISSNYNIRKLKLIHLVLICNETKGLQIAKIWKFWKTKTPWGVSNGPTMLSGKHLLLFYVIHDKKKSIWLQLNIPKSTLKVLLDEHTFYPKKSRLKLVFKDVEKEPRKARFLWDLGLLWGNPIWST